MFSGEYKNKSHGSYHDIVSLHLGLLIGQFVILDFKTVRKITDCQFSSILKVNLQYLLFGCQIHNRHASQIKIIKLFPVVKQGVKCIVHKHAVFTCGTELEGTGIHP